MIATELEDMQYQADRRRKRFEKVDPENRLVAGQLEKDWEQALQEVARTNRRLEEALQDRVPLAAGMREHLLEMGENLARLWEEPSTTPVLKKQVLRSVIEMIWVDVDVERDKVCAEIQWKSKLVTKIEIDKRSRPSSQKYLEENTVELVVLLAKRFSDESIVRHLNRLGLKTGRGNNWTEPRLRHLRSRNKIKNSHQAGTHMTLTEAAEELGVTMRQLKALVKGGWLEVETVHEKAPSLVKKHDLVAAPLQKQVEKLKTRGSVSPQTQNQPTLF